MSQLTEEFNADVCYWLSCSGTLASHREKLLQLAGSESKSAVTDLYIFLRDYSERNGLEWRQEFMEIFSRQSESLPDVDRSNEWGRMLHAYIERRDVTAVRRFLEEIGIRDWNLVPIATEREPEVYPIDTPDDAGELPGDKARRLNEPGIESLLREVREVVLERHRREWKSQFAAESQ